MKPSKASKMEVQVTVRFVGDHVDPQLLTSKLGIKPSKAHKKGEQTHKQSSSVYPTGYWGIDSPYALDQPFKKHLEYLLDLLEPKISILQQLREIGLCPNVFCGFSPLEEELSTFIDLESNILERIARIGASLDMHIYCWYAEEIKLGT